MNLLRRCLLLLLLVALPAQSVLAAAGWHCAVAWRAAAASGVTLAPHALHALASDVGMVEATAPTAHPHAHGKPAAASDTAGGAPDTPASGKPAPDAARGNAPCCATAVLPAGFVTPQPLPRSRAAAPGLPAAYLDPWLATPRKPPRLIA
ncbi:hypothetical protein [Derxia gummosa]|uniref:Uncharacterized protein n=1 Tax=Derxia gummosa DSM 723 TaxID=1121388 RepID=A0A8B6X620_9BURK|nr:hypothetical protein [Derxia gummosa]